ncbi:MAG: TauD/TfdA family dioxygenase [Actinomycetota bacterium]|jgi:alpha-ketoglutarate-dependent taurine dioxygenase|nr:TauD/TfdA family dioxygenase [Actinomycetota bacterium]
MQLEITPLADEPLGAIVRGWQPDEPLDDTTRSEISTALAKHLVLVFRGQDQPTDAELVQFVEAFGEPIKGSEWFRDAGDLPEILPVTNVVDEDGIPLGTGGAGPLEWHADYSYVPRPGKESFLNAVELPDDPPHTYFCSMYTALEDLPGETVERLRSLRATHSITNYVVDDEGSPEYDLRNEFAAKKQRDRELGVERPDIPVAEHPLVFVHPDTGREILYASRGITRQVLGLPREESSALLKEMHLHATAPERVYAHDWELGDLVMFDTLGALHKRDAWDPGERRVMRQLSTRC